MFFRFLILVLIVFCSGCAGLGTIKKTTQLTSGMSMTQVKTILGAPSQTEFSGEKIIWKYSLHKYFVGWIPYYLTFDKGTQELEAWAANQGEYYQQQQAMMDVAQEIGQQNQQAQYQRQQLELQQQALQIERQKAMIQAVPRSTHTNCTRFGDQISCDSY